MNHESFSAECLAQQWLSSVLSIQMKQKSHLNITLCYVIIMLLLCYYVMNIVFPTFEQNSVSCKTLLSINFNHLR